MKVKLFKDIEETSRRISIIRSMQKKTGLSDYDKERKILADVGKALLELSEDRTNTLANIISCIATNKSLLDLAIKQLRKDYRAEDEHIHNSLTPNLTTAIK